MRDNQTDLISGISDVKKKLEESVIHSEIGNKTFAEIVGIEENPAALVEPIKKAMR